MVIFCLLGGLSALVGLKYYSDGQRYGIQNFADINRSHIVPQAHKPADWHLSHGDVRSGSRPTWGVVGVSFGVLSSIKPRFLAYCPVRG
ncbi:hypothetical protein AOQ84DRAFT_33242 [Glonium stellatum]|uniref:Uncharacterized protein n=1 Tax=Glonium stellatum TaxID=574774 RepID=A0A8E2F2N8_9PEZI|nr:hypothetical protein AOQ84DRAFT_33242 [Glonium stellatum]